MCVTPPVHNEISIHITSIYCVSCLQCPVGGSDNSRLMCCAWGSLSGKQHQIGCFSQGSATTLFV